MVDWNEVNDLLLKEYARPGILRHSQISSLRWVARHLVEHGVLLADEVGLGKTRIAVAVMHAVHRLGGKAIAIVPPRLMHQWEGEYRELARDLKTIAGLDTDMMTEPGALARRHLRSYWQLFEYGTEFPVLERVPFALISHNFGIPLKLGKSSQQWRWILPLLVVHAQARRRNYKSRFRGVRKCLRNEDIQLLNTAANWLADNISKSLMERLRALDLTMTKAGNPYRSDPQCMEGRAVYTAMIGSLIGTPDLIVIDEAHKSREQQTDNDDGHSYKRLPLLLGAFPSRGNVRRLALTATPMELSAEDWQPMLQRLGEPAAHVKMRCDKIAEFKKVGEEMRTVGPGDEEGLERLIAAARLYENALCDIMTRRRWRDETLMTRFRESIHVTRSHDAQPHRRWSQQPIALEALDRDGRAAVVAAEGLTLAALGSDIGFKEKQQAARFSAGLVDPFAEIEEAEREIVDGITESSAGDASSKQWEQAKTRRVDYWRQALRRHSSGCYAPAIAPLAHPRVTSAVKIVEQATESGEKILVFGMFNQPLRALNRALNARHHLRELVAGRATLRPATINDADLLYCSDQLSREIPDKAWPTSEKELKGNEKRALKTYRKLERQRAGLVDSVTRDLGLSNGAHAPIARRWVSQLLLDRQLSQADGELTPEIARTTVEEAFEAARRDVTEPNEMQSADDEDKPGTTNIQQTIARLADALRDEVGAAGRNVPIQRSPFSRLLIGETKPLTQRILQATFNQPGLNPRVLITQARVGSEGLNLQRACKCVLLFHLDWNPARIEQQIGRVDRYASLWTTEADRWLEGKQEATPYIDVIALTFSGTYDQMKTVRIINRMKSLKAFLFGEILDPEVMEAMPSDWQKRLEQGAPDFSPLRKDRTDPLLR